MKKIHVNVPPRAQSSYDILIEAGCLEHILDTAKARFPDRGFFIVTDANLKTAGHLDTLLSGTGIPVFVIDPPGEISKHIATVTAIIEAMEKAFLGRDTVVVALGGGTVGDIAGVCAGLFKRGVEVIQIPSTTVAQADSAIGGKTGVDSTLSKNAYGLFWHPAAVYVDVKTLLTLDEREFRSGLAESVKHALIADSNYFTWMQENLDAVLSRDLKTLEKLAEYNCKIKAAVVEQDPTEQNMRRILNYGHTLGHAVESASGYTILHGEAVAIGMAGASYIGMELGLTSVADHQRILDVLTGLGLETRIPTGMETAALWDIMKRDKKAASGRPKWVLLKQIGGTLCRSGQWACDVDEKIVDRAIETLRGH